MARYVAISGQVRRLSQLTMGFDEIAAWKQEKGNFSRTESHSAVKKPTIFDLRVYTPMTKSNTWNISYAPEAKVEYRRPLPATRAGIYSRHFPARRLFTAQVETPVIRIPSPLNTFSSLAANIRPIVLPGPLLGAELRASQIADIPSIEILRRLYIEVDERPLAETTQEEQEERPTTTEPEKQQPGPSTPLTPEKGSEPKTGLDDYPAPFPSINGRLPPPIRRQRPSPRWDPSQVPYEYP